MSKFFRTLNRSIKSGFVKFGRLYYISVPLSLFFALIITLCGLLAFGYGFSNHLNNSINSRVNVVVYFDRQSPDDLTKELVGKVEQNQLVKRIDFSSRERNLEVFKERNKNNPTALQALSEIGINPFGASLVVFARDTRDYESINKTLVDLKESYKSSDGSSPIESITYEENKAAISQLANMLSKGKAALFGLMLVLGAILFFVLFLAQRLASQYDREEIKIMKIVGAPTILTIGPSGVMGGLAGFVGSIIALFVLYFIALKSKVYTDAFDNFDMLYWYTNNINQFILYTILTATLIGFFFSLIAARRHL
jgi:cell division transport system permease protein